MYVIIFAKIPLYASILLHAYRNIICKGAKPLKTVADRLREYREKKKLSPDEVAESLGIDKSLYLSWEAGESEPDTESLLLIAHFFGTNGSALLYGSDGMGSKTMFPRDASPSPTPISDWRFLSGVLLAFAGGAGVLLFIMRYMNGNVDTIAKLFEVGGAALIALIAVFVGGIVICVVSCALNSRNKKNRNNKNEKKKR